APELAPPRHTRAPPLGGVLLTSGELDHTIGLITMREAPALTIYATAAVRDGLPFAATLASYTQVHWHTVTVGEPITLDGGLTATAFAPSGKRPRYAGASATGEWTVAYRFADVRTGRSLVYAPGLADWSPAFAAGIQGA